MPAADRSRKLIQHTAETCVDCGLCVSQCAFLKNTGSPLHIAQEGLTSSDKHNKAAIGSYDCSMCKLCSAVCPVDARPAEMFTELRNYAQSCNLFDLKKYSPLLSYEKAGRRFPFKDSIIPQGCETAFFPGCTLPALFPTATINAYSSLKYKDKKLGLILDCCSKPSKMLGLKELHGKAIAELADRITKHGIKRILTGCPNCHMTLKEFNPAFEVISIYEELYNLNITTVTPYISEITIHDPCVTRYEDHIHDCIRNLLTRAGVKITEMKHSKRKTVCCGEGGALPFHNPDHADSWSEKRITEAQKTNLPMATYCAGCANFLSSKHPTTHILDLLMVKRKEIPKPVQFPFNYANRLLLRYSARLK